MTFGGEMKHIRQKRKVGRPPKTGLGAEENPLSDKTQEERRMLFLETAARLFETRGYSETSVKDITDELGFTKSVFYYYWDNKKEIIQEIHDRALREVNERLDEVEAEHDLPQERIEAAIRAHLRSVLQNRSLTAVHLGDLHLSEETHGRKRAYTRRFQRLMEDGIAAGVIREQNPKILAFAILNVCNALTTWYSPTGHLSPEEVEDFYVSFILHGSATPLFDPADG
jgi:TetR/AcrR family transcriptional regulator, cholesterol catabolism regulator